MFKNAFYFLSMLVLFASAPAHGKTKQFPSALDSLHFSCYWQPEFADSLPCRLTFLHDTLEITTRGGFTLWRKERLSGNIEISYSACVMDEGKPGDRLSDLNCFWMASDPLFPKDVLKRSPWRKGVFEKYYSLRMYYLGYGGNRNSTTRFRKYDGDWEAFSQKNIRPNILTEYTDSAHLLKPNRWYNIRIVCRGNRIQYFMDNELLVDYEDNQALKSGWFGFRTTWARVRITEFRVEKIEGSRN